MPWSWNLAWLGESWYPTHCYYNIVISTEHHRLRNYTCIPILYTSLQLTRSYIENHVHWTYSITLHARKNTNAASPQLNQHTSLRQFHIAVLFTGQSRALTWRWMLIPLTLDDCCLIYSAQSSENLGWSIFSLNKAFRHAWQLFWDSVFCCVNQVWMPLQHMKSFSKTVLFSLFSLLQLKVENTHAGTTPYTAHQIHTET